MEELEPVKMTKETLEISGERKLYNYTFENMPPPEPSKPREEAEQSGGENH
jgi:hypothetical protein